MKQCYNTRIKWTKYILDLFDPLRLVILDIRIRLVNKIPKIQLNHTLKQTFLSVIMVPWTRSSDENVSKKASLNCNITILTRGVK